MSSSSLFNLPILTEATQNKSSELVAKFIPMNKDVYIIPISYI